MAIAIPANSIAINQMLIYMPDFLATLKTIPEDQAIGVKMNWHHLFDKAALEILNSILPKINRYRLKLKSINTGLAS